MDRRFGFARLTPCDYARANPQRLSAGRGIRIDIVKARDVFMEVSIRGLIGTSQESRSDGQIIRTSSLFTNCVRKYLLSQSSEMQFKLAPSSGFGFTSSTC